MSTISRRTFLKLAGVTAVATAGASMLTGCKIMEDVEVTIKVHPEGSDEYTSLGSTTMPYGVVKLVMIDPIGVLNIVKKQYPEYKDVQVEVDKEVPNNGKILTDPETGKMTMELTIKVLMVEVEYEVLINGERVTSGKHAFPKGVTSIDEATARKIIAEVGKNNDKVPTNYEFDSSVANNLKVVDGKIIVALKVDVCEIV